ncbi:MAG: response regulator [Leptolyngbyaceae cyanobacterium HOT.MB2.61]|nr:response regulator [Leptolyngbyaceae cyanobacterium HOT.MB2.61]
MPKILVIEDEQPVRINIVAMLKAEGFQAIPAEDGQDGVQLAQEHIPDLIICDITMPRLDGFGVLEVLQQTPATSTIPFIFLSAKSERSDFRRGMNLGADDYLTKSFTRTELLEAICTRLTKHAAVMELKQKLEEIQQSNLLKDDFVSTVAHELRSPLATMKMAIQLLQTTQDARRHLTYLEVLQSACNHEIELIDNLLDLQRLEAQTYQDDIEQIDLPTWVPRVVEPIRMRTQQRQQIVQIDISPDLPLMMINRFGLERIITELFTNACK